MAGSRDVHSNDSAIYDDNDTISNKPDDEAIGHVEKNGRDQVANSRACSFGSMSENEAEIEWQEAVIYPGHIQGNHKPLCDLSPTFTAGNCLFSPFNGSSPINVKWLLALSLILIQLDISANPVKVSESLQS
jgi:hypothetical protein